MVSRVFADDAHLTAQHIHHHCWFTTILDASLLGTKTTPSLSQTVSRGRWVSKTSSAGRCITQLRHEMLDVEVAGR